MTLPRCGRIILVKFDELVLVMQWLCSGYPNVTAYSQVESMVTFIMQSASHRCDSYKCFVTTWCEEWWQNDSASSFIHPQVWRSPIWGETNIYLEVSLAPLLLLLKLLVPSLLQIGLNGEHVWEVCGAPVTVFFVFFSLCWKSQFPALIVLEWANWCRTIL